MAVAGRLTSGAGGQSAYLDYEEPQPKKGGGITAYIPAAAAALSFLPGVGTVGGALLGGGGEALRQILNDEELDFGKVSGEAALSAVPFAAGRAIKTARGAAGTTKEAIKATKDIPVSRNLFNDLKTSTAPKPAAGGGIDEVAEATTPSTTTLLGKWKGEARGITPGVKVAGQDQLGVEDADSLNAFLDQVGIQRGSAASQLAALEQRKKVWGTQIGDIVKTRNRDVALGELTTVKDRIAANIGKLAGLPKAAPETALVDASGKAIIEVGGDVVKHPYADALYADLGKVKNLEDLNNFRKQLDMDAINYGRNSNAPDPVKEQIAKAFRGGVSTHIGEQIPELKGVQQLYSQGANAEDFLKAAAKNPAGISVPFVGQSQNIGGRMIQGAKAAIGGAGDTAPTGGNSLLSKVKTGAANTGKYGISFAKQELGRAGVAAAGLPSPSFEAQMANMEPRPQEPLDATTEADLLIEGEESLEGDLPPGGISDEQMQGLLTQALNAPDLKTQTALLANYKTIADIREKYGTGNSKKPLSAVAASQVANAKSGLEALQGIRGMLSDDPSLPIKNLAPGSIGRNITGAGTYEAAREEIIDVLARLRTGAAITAKEEERFRAQLPQVGDNAQTVAYKLNLYERLFSRLIANHEGGSPELELAGVTQN